MRKAISEQYIIELLDKDTEKGFGLLVEKYQATLSIFALKYVDSFDFAEDIVQDVLINFWENKRYKNIKTSLKSYLLSAVKNKSLKYIQKSGRILISDIEDASDELIVDNPNEQWIEEQKQKLKIELENLPEKRREVLECIVFRGMKYKEAAEELDVSVNTIKTHLVKALKQLRTSLNIIVWLIS
ncbi:MAG: RNA polymerase sigma-70 factor [Marinifilaceae bacterium]|jgi:RNA polymerase sigma-70 factor (ECF subfamily)|nr:RNA polymerase sigma-70 factor [Marinifilaceae bacterium]